MLFRSTLIYTAENTNTTSLATNSFGQNFNVTVVQLASAFSSLINGGYYYQPHLVKKIVDGNGNTVEAIEPVVLKQTVSKQTSDTIKQYLYSTVSEGTGKSAKVEGYSMGGKTGTAQKGDRDQKKYVVSFIGFAPVENPEVLVYVVIDEANAPIERQSSALATDLAKKIFTEILPYLNIFQDEATEGDGSGNPEGGTPEDSEGTTQGTEGDTPEGTGEAPEGDTPEGGEGNPEGAAPEGGEGNPEGNTPEGGEGNPEGEGQEYPPDGVPEAMPEGGAAPEEEG